jgi:hypothetical protein
MKRVAQRVAPNGRSFLPGTWDRSRLGDPLDRPPEVRLHSVDACNSVIRTWLVEEERFGGWYVNLEQPWTRIVVGFDSAWRSKFWRRRS